MTFVAEITHHFKHSETFRRVRVHNLPLDEQPTYMYIALIGYDTHSPDGPGDAAMKWRAPVKNKETNDFVQMMPLPWALESEDCELRNDCAGHCDGHDEECFCALMAAETEAKATVDPEWDIPTKDFVPNPMWWERLLGGEAE